MYGDTPRDLMATLNSMGDVAMRRNLNNRLAALVVSNPFRHVIACFAGYDPAILARQYDEARRSCAQLDLSDPRLRGGERRPLTRDQSW